MKKIILYLIASFTILSGADGQSKWKIVNEGIGMWKSIWNMDYMNATTAWIFGSSGSNDSLCVFKTTDGGITWLPDTVAEQYEILEMDFLNDTLGWARGTGIYKTTDGGRTWFNQMSGVGDDPLVKNIYAVDDSTVCVFEDNNLFKTTDGGENWLEVTPPGDYFFSNAFFLNDSTGVLVGNNENDDRGLFILRTTDGGENWNARGTEFYEIYDIELLNGSIGYFRTRDHLYKSLNSFNSWFAVTNEENSILAYHIFDDGSAVSVMDDGTATHIGKSEDGGLSWASMGNQTLPAGWEYHFYFFENIGYLICFYPFFGGNFFLKTIDQGITWEILSISYPFKDLFIKNEKEVFISGGMRGVHFGYADLIRTDNAFKTFDFLLGQEGQWKSRADPLFFIQFIGELVGVYANAYDLYRTSDGGDTWIVDNTIDHPFDICFINESIGYAVAFGVNNYGEFGIYKTTNGGESWNGVYSYGVEDLPNSIFFIEENVGWGIGWSGDFCGDPENCGGGPTLIKYDDEQGWREIPLETNLPLNKIRFFDHETGWISGGYSYHYNDDHDHHPLFLRSEDGGESWSDISRVNYLINDFYFETIDHGRAVGEDSIGRGVILETFDSGLTWEAVVDELSAPLNAVHFKDGHAWAAGDNGLILHMYDTTYVSRVEQPDSFIDSEVLLRLYPNPVNSILNIETEISDSYNINVTTLNGQQIFSKKLKGTTHQFDLSSFQKGVYFITIRSKDSVTTRKVIKL